MNRSVVLIATIYFFGSLRTLSALEPCEIEIIDASNNWPVPMVELRTTHGVRFVSDNAGRIAFDLPELMGVETWFHIRGHGYNVKQDIFGYRGVKLTPQSGKKLQVKLERKLPAKRLGRITGGGLFGESQKLGKELDWKEQGILGCDSVQNTVHHGKLFWGWGDTTLPGYPLGRFHMLGATTELQPLQSFQPPVRLRYHYVTDKDSVPRNVAKLPGNGPTWLSGYASLPDKTGAKRLVATYSKIKPPLAEYERGLCVWNEQNQNFETFRVLWKHSDTEPKPPGTPHGHAFSYVDEQQKEWIYFGDPLPTLRCRATFEDWSEPKRWETITPQSHIQSVDGDNIVPHRGAIAWNEYRKRWVTVFTQMGGDSSTLGELWYAESDAPAGPWSKAIHVVTHDKYTFYNPQLHPEFTSENSPILIFEATYTHTFSKTSSPTPRHDYNQILYRLDLNEIFPH